MIFYAIPIISSATTAASAAVFLQFVEWAVTILLTIAAFPLLKQAGMFFLMKLYEAFIQYQYLF